MLPVKDSGFYTITLTSIKKAGNTIADLQSIQFIRNRNGKYALQSESKTQCGFRAFKISFA
jgi:hypothetical protein